MALLVRNGSKYTVSITRKIPVHPKLPTEPPNNHLELSNLDRQCPTLVYAVYFYTSPPNVSFSHVLDGLKLGLEETLDVWNPAAGRLVRDPNDGNKLNIRCNNEGAVMVEAYVGTKMEEIGELSEYDEFFENLVYKPSFDHGDFTEIPLVVVQVTRFACEGFSIGIGMSHSLFDGPAAYDFLRAWSSNSTLTKENKCIEVPSPVHDRGKLLIISTSRAQMINTPTSSDHKGTDRATAIDHLYKLITNTAMDLEISRGPSGMACLKFVHKTFRLSEDAVERLKKKSNKSGNFSCSSFEVIAAHIWKARTKALRIQNKMNVCLQFSVDARRTMSLPTGFSGNAYVLASIMVTAEELEKSSYEEIIEKIRAAKGSVNEAYVKTYIRDLEGSQGNTTLPPMKELMIVSDLTRMPFHDVGFLGRKAGFVSPLVPPVQEVAYLMKSPKDVKGIDVRIGLFPEIVDDFSRYFSTLEA